MGYINHSGGAKGADMMWDQTGRKYGFNNHKHWTVKDLVGIDKELKETIEADVKAAAIALKRPTSEFKGKNLVRRNWFQVANADAIFAVGRVIDPGKKDMRGFVNTTDKMIVAGGTGWAVEMAIQKHKPVYVFDMEINMWCYWDYQYDVFAPYVGRHLGKASKIPALTEKYAGIGSRELTPEGIKAIDDVYKYRVILDSFKPGEL